MSKNKWLVISASVLLLLVLFWFLIPSPETQSPILPKTEQTSANPPKEQTRKALPKNKTEKASPVITDNALPTPLGQKPPAPPVIEEDLETYAFVFIDEETQKPIEGISYTLTTDKRQFLKEEGQASDKKGRIVLSLAKDTPYLLILQHHQYKRRLHEFNTAELSNEDGNIIEMAVVHNIFYGIVVDPDGQPIPDAQITAERFTNRRPNPHAYKDPEANFFPSKQKNLPAPLATTRTQADGRFQFNRGALTKLELLISKEGYYQGPPQSANQKNLSEEQTFVLKPLRPFQGQVVDPDGQGIESVAVFFRDSYPNHQRGIVYTDSNGYYNFKGAPAKFHLKFFKPGFSIERLKNIDSTGDFRQVVLTPGPIQRIRTLDSQQRPLPNVAVFVNVTNFLHVAFDAHYRDKHQTLPVEEPFAVTDQDGYLEIPGTNQQPVDLHLRLPGYRHLDTTITAKGDVQELTLFKRASVSGYVTNEEGKSIENATIMLFDESSSIQSKTDRDGFYEIYDCPPGRHFFRAEAEGYQIRLSPTLLIEAESIYEDLNFQLEPGYSLRGKVLDQDGEPQNSVGVYFVDNGKDYKTRHRGWRATTDKHGNYTLLGLPPGTHEFRAKHYSQKKDGALIEIKAHHENLHNFILRDEKVTTRIRVVTEADTNTGLPFATLRVRGQDQDEQQLQTDEQGLLTFEATPNTNYFITLMHDSLMGSTLVRPLTSDPEDKVHLFVAMEPYTVRGQIHSPFPIPYQNLQAIGLNQHSNESLEFTYSGDTAHYVLTTGRPILSVVIKDPINDLIDSVIFNLQEKQSTHDFHISKTVEFVGTLKQGSQPLRNRRLTLIPQHSTIKRYAATFADGEFTFKDLTAGTYEFTIQGKNGFKRILEIKNDMRFDYSFPAAPVYGTVYDSEGTPIPGARILISTDVFERNGFVISDESGQFIFDDVALHEQIVEINHDDYAQARMTITPEGDQFMPIQVTLRPKNTLELQLNAREGSESTVFLINPQTGDLAFIKSYLVQGGRMVMKDLPQGTWQMVVVNNAEAVYIPNLQLPRSNMSVTLTPAITLYLKAHQNGTLDLQSESGLHYFWPSGKQMGVDISILRGLNNEPWTLRYTTDSGEVEEYPISPNQMMQHLELGK